MSRETGSLKIMTQEDGTFKGTYIESFEQWSMWSSDHDTIEKYDITFKTRDEVRAFVNDRHYENNFFHLDEIKYVKNDKDGQWYRTR